MRNQKITKKNKLNNNKKNFYKDLKKKKKHIQTITKKKN